MYRRPRARWGTAAALSLIVLGAGAGAWAAEDGDAPIDLGELRDKLRVVSDGKGHYLVTQAFDPSGALYYGDGKVFYAQRVIGGGSSGDGSKPDDRYDQVFWDPRFSDGWQRSFAFQGGKYAVQCGKRAAAFTAEADDKSRALLGAAKFYPPRWKHAAYALARDNAGNYYYVDHLREPDTLSFRLYIGKRGLMHQAKMTNIVSDHEGDIFATKSGSLRLVLDKRESSWIANQKKTPLLSLSVADNAAMIYVDLGVYSGQRLGTPCDDL